VTDTKNAAGLFACRQDPLRTGRCKRERFLTKNLLAGLKRSDGHFFVQKVRGHDRNRVEVGAPDQAPVVVYEFQLVGSGKRRRHFHVDVASGNDPEARALCKAGHDLLAPPAQPDNSNTDHRSPALSLNDLRSALNFEQTQVVGEKLRWDGALKLHECDCTKCSGKI